MAGYVQTRFSSPAFLVLLMSGMLLLQDGALGAQATTLSQSSVIDFAEETAKSQDRDTENHLAWLEEADRLMAELMSLDVRMYTCICEAGNYENRSSLIEKRNYNRKLVYELTLARNEVLRGLPDGDAMGIYTSKRFIK